MTTSPTDVGFGNDLKQREKPRADRSCSSCQRRKLRCDREPPPRGCSTCRKSQLPCMYTDQRGNDIGHSTTRAGRKKTRGPYRKDRTPREKELENCVLTLTEKCSDLESQLQRTTVRLDSCRPDTLRDDSFTTTSAEILPFAPVASSKLYDAGSVTYRQPEPALVLELWIRFVSAVDPFTKLIHCPTVSQAVLSATDRQESQPSDLEPLMLSIYIASLNSLEVSEIHTKLEASKEDLVLSYRMVLEQFLLRADAEPYSVTFTLLQAGLIHLGSLRRQAGCDRSLNISTLFELTLRLARHLRMDNPASYSALSPFEAEYRRRAWWALCRYKSGYAEDFEENSVTERSAEVALPSNYNDSDLDPTMTTYPVPREGLSELSILLMQFKVVKLLTRITAMHSLRSDGEQDLMSRIQQLILDTKTEIELEILSRCDVSRPFDWLIILAGKVILSKVEITLLESSLTVGLHPGRDAFHDVKMLLSLDIIESHQLIATDPRLYMWQWNWKHSHQWHSTIYVLDELAKRPEAKVATRAWEAINLVMTTPNILDKHGMTVQTRTKLLESHDRALQARERLLHNRASIPYSRPILP